ncbi:MAG: DoxX family protein [Opitutales bacterium]|jgi:hypothetical protein|nr:DoxX family protein [Opitutales bacterium]MDG2168842.1 DoxX family protein [Opitutales bacterium]
METLLSITQIIAGLSVLNAWTLRTNQPTAWRGGESTSMRQEFETYGLPIWFMKLVKWTKIPLALLLVAGVWIPYVTKPAAMGLGLLMLGAVTMHMRIDDPLKKSFPAAFILLTCVTLAAN